MSLRIPACLGLVLLSTAACSSYRQHDVATVSLADQVAAVKVDHAPAPMRITAMTYVPDNQASARGGVYRVQQ